MWRDFTYLKSEEGSETVLSLHSCLFTCTINCKDSSCKMLQPVSVKKVGSEQQTEVRES